MHRLRRYFIAGLVVWLPLWATFFVIHFLVQLMDKTLSLIPHAYQPKQLIGTEIPGLGLIFTVLILFLTGLFVTNFLGKKVMALWERILSRIPLVRTIYYAVKQVVDALIQPAGKSFRKVLIVEYPRHGVWSIAFQTSDQFIGSPHPDEVVTVFIPTTPNPTSGFLVIVPKTDTRELDMTIEEALKMVISLGVIMPPRFSKHLDKTDKQQENS